MNHSKVGIKKVINETRTTAKINKANHRQHPKLNEEEALAKPPNSGGFTLFLAKPRHKLDPHHSLHYNCKYTLINVTSVSA